MANYCEENLEFYNYDERKQWIDKINAYTNGNYYTKFWHGFLNYYSEETHERIGYEVVQDGYYFINKEQKDCFL